MNYLILGLFFILTSAFAQQSVELTFKGKSKHQVERIVAFEDASNFGYIQGNNLVVVRQNKKMSYANIQLGTIAFADLFNPLKIAIFYKDFNTVVIVDNRLNEIYKIDFNTFSPFRNVTFASTGNDNTLWLYNQDTQQLEVFDYKLKSTRAKTLPITSDVYDLESNYNSAWILTKDHLLSYNYFGSMTFKIQNSGYTQLSEFNENVILQNENTLFYLNAKTQKITELKLSGLLIKAFFVKDETLYIYDGEFLHYYFIKTY